MASVGRSSHGTTYSFYVRYPDSYPQVLYQETESIPVLYHAVGLWQSEAYGRQANTCYLSMGYTGECTLIELSIGKVG